MIKQFILKCCTFLYPQVVDILIRLVEYSIEQHFHPDFSERDVYLDSRYTSAIVRTYPRLSKNRKKSHLFFPPDWLKLSMKRMSLTSTVQGITPQ